MKASKLLAACLLAQCAAALGCTSTEWGSDHKKVHFVGSAAVTLIGIQVTQSVWEGVAIGAAVGLAREAYKVHAGGQCEWSSMAWDAAGIALGAAGSHWLVTKNGATTSVQYVRAF